MIIHDVAQNSDAWERLRLGIPTSSEFHRIVCPQMGKQHVCVKCGTEYPRARKKPCECGGEILSVEVVKPSTQRDPYMHRLLAEWYLDHPLMDPESQFRSSFMERGHELEERAARAYEFLKSVETHKVGFITDDAGLVGTSPDRLVGDEGIVEFKCPAANTQMGYMLTKSVEGDYFPQLQGQLLITGRKWVDICAYGDEMPTVIVHVERNEEYIAQLQEHLVEFVRQMVNARARIEQEYGLPERPQPVEDPMGITEDDAEAIIRDRFPKTPGPAPATAGEGGGCI